MAKKETSKFKCGQCSLAAWIHDNVTNAGKLFLLKCPHYKGGEAYHFAKDTACEHFEKRERESTLD